MDDEEETYRLWKIRKTIMQVNDMRYNLFIMLGRIWQDNTVLVLYLNDLRLVKGILDEITIF